MKTLSGRSPLKTRFVFLITTSNLQFTKGFQPSIVLINISMGFAISSMELFNDRYTGFKKS